MKEIPLTQGAIAIVDDEDFEHVSAYKWRVNRYRYVSYASHSYYIGRTESGRKEVGSVLMHRLIMNAPEGVEVDHRNGDGLDNRRANLRLCTVSQNQQNRIQLPRNTSGFRGVTRIKKYANRWQASIGNLYIGWYATPEAAAHAYDAKARELYGEFARPNFPDTREPVPIRLPRGGRSARR